MHFVRFRLSATALNTTIYGLLTSGILASVLTSATLAQTASSTPDPTEPHPYEEGKRLLENAQYAAAIAAFEQELARQPNHPHSLFQKARAQEARGHIDGAITTYQTLIAAHPDQLEAYNNLARLQLAANPLRDSTQAEDGRKIALATLEQGIEAHPQMRELFANLRSLYWDISRENYRAALKLPAEQQSLDLIALNALGAPVHLPQPEPAPEPEPEVLVAQTPAPVCEPAPTAETTIAAIDETETLPAKTITETETSLAEVVTETRIATTQEMVGETPQPDTEPSSSPASGTSTKPLLTQAEIAISEANAANTDANQPAPSPEAKEDNFNPEISPQESVTAFLHSWADSWSERNPEQFVAHYQASYRGKLPSAQAWRRDRARNFAAKSFIWVEISRIQFTPAGEGFRVTFDQHYRSDNYQDKVRKRLDLIPHDGGWKIRQELTLRALP